MDILHAIPVTLQSHVICHKTCTWTSKLPFTGISTKYINLEYHSACPLVRIGTPTLSPLNERSPHPLGPKWGGQACLRERGWRGSQFGQLEKKPSSLSTLCTIGGFNVSNLIGIKRRMIDIGKKITCYFLQNVWKSTVFFRMCILRFHKVLICMT